MPTRQTIKTATDLIPQQQQHAVLSNNNNNIHPRREDELETHERMKKMPLRDVDELVNEIKLNLRLKTTSDVSNSVGGAGAKVRTARKLARIQSVPYYVKTSSCAAQSCGAATKDEASEGVHLKTCQTCQLKLRQRRQTTSTSPPDDPYQLLQELLKEGGLIKEAVRRLNYIGGGGEETKCFDYDQDDYEPSSSAAVQVILPPV